MRAKLRKRQARKRETAPSTHTVYSAQGGRKAIHFRLVLLLLLSCFFCLSLPPLCPQDAAASDYFLAVARTLPRVSKACRRRRADPDPVRDPQSNCRLSRWTTYLKRREGIISDASHKQNGRPALQFPAPPTTRGVSKERERHGNPGKSRQSSPPPPPKKLLLLSLCSSGNGVSPRHKQSKQAIPFSFSQASQEAPLSVTIMYSLAVFSVRPQVHVRASEKKKSLSFSPLSRSVSTGRIPIGGGVDGECEREKRESNTKQWPLMLLQMLSLSLHSPQHVLAAAAIAPDQHVSKQASNADIHRSVAEEEAPIVMPPSSLAAAAAGW